MYLKKFNILPGFNICFAYTIIYLTVILILPLSVLFIKVSEIKFVDLVNIIYRERVLCAFALTFKMALFAALFNSVFGILISFTLVRFNFFGKNFLDSIIDLPFALPTAIAGIALANLYSKEGWIGKYLYYFDIQIAFTSIGIMVALIFVTLPFVVRTIEPVIMSLDKEIENAAEILGASKFVIFYKIIIPNIFPAILSGFTMAFARGLSEYGSVIFIAGNIPKVSEIVSLIIINDLEQYDYNSATAVAFLMLITSFILLLTINYVQKYSGRFKS